MATKHEIKKFIERRKSEALDKSDQEYQQSIAEIKHSFIERHSSEISGIKIELEAASDFLERLCESAKLEGIMHHPKNWASPGYYIDAAFEKISGQDITECFRFPEIDKAKQVHELKDEDIRYEYDKLIAISQTMSAKDGLALLKSLGFDTTELEVEKPVTALTISIDREKLFL